MNWFAPAEQIREELKWVSFGKFHDEPARTTLLKDISDSHLLHIISWIKENINCYTENILYIMEAEQKYRTINYIFISDYDT